GPIPLANALVIALNVVVFFLNQLGMPLQVVGQGTGLFSIVLYGFSHANALHLLGNMWFLWLFGNPVNGRVGNGYYLICYLGTILSLGVVARFLIPAEFGLVGSSGAIFAMEVLFWMLMPRT